MQSGQGGIRWNSTNSQIQLMDENKNWVNWKPFDPNKFYIFKGSEGIDRSGGWERNVGNNTTVTITSDQIYFRDASSYSGGIINTTSSFDFSPYNRLSFIYKTSSNSATSNFNIYTFKPVSGSASALSKSSIIGTDYHECILDITTYNSNYWVALGVPNNTDRTQVWVSDIYLWNSN